MPAPRVFPREPKSLLQANVTIDHRSQITEERLGTRTERERERLAEKERKKARERAKGDGAKKPMETEREGEVDGRGRERERENERKKDMNKKKRERERRRSGGLDGGEGNRKGGGNNRAITVHGMTRRATESGKETPHGRRQRPFTDLSKSSARSTGVSNVMIG